MEHYETVLTEMGFTELRIKLARQATKGGIEEMVDWLMTQQKQPEKTL
jgi:hypothetical protein